MKPLVLAFLLSSFARCATLTVSPSLILECTNGRGQVKITWAGASGPVQIRVQQVDGPEFAAGDTDGSADTGLWVTDGMAFLLVNAAGITEASAVAHLNCGGTVSTIETGLSGGSYFPLQVGNQWVYRINADLVTNQYVTYSITGTEVIDSKTYFVMAGQEFILRLRADSSGVIWMYNPSGDQVYLDPGASTSQKTSSTVSLGTFPDSLATTIQTASLKTVSAYVRGLGLARQLLYSRPGNDEVLGEIFDLIEVRLPGIHFVAQLPSISLSVDDAEPDLTGQRAPNCTVPVLDGPGRYWPCIGARLETALLPGTDIALQLTDAAGSIVFGELLKPDQSGSVLRRISLPLYVSPLRLPRLLLSPGQYQLSVRASKDGQDVATSRLNVNVH